MQIVTNTSYGFLLKDEKENIAGELVYKDPHLNLAEIITDKRLIVEKTANGLWNSYCIEKDKKVKKGELKVTSSNIISIYFEKKSIKYKFKKSGGWKARFVLLNKDDEELLAFLPNINWQKKTYEFALQLNEEYAKEI
jgi:hypothetical protein